MSTEQSKRIVIIDDDSDDTLLLCRALKGYNKKFDCITFDDPEEALKSLLGSDSVIPDFIFLDINMPKLNGRECLEIIRADARFDSVNIAIISTYMPVETVEGWLQDGAQYAVVKPLTWDRFQAVMRDIFDERKLMG